MSSSSDSSASQTGNKIKKKSGMTDEEISAFVDILADLSEAQRKTLVNPNCKRDISVVKEQIWTDIIKKLFPHMDEVKVKKKLLQVKSKFAKLRMTVKANRAAANAELKATGGGSTKKVKKPKMQEVYTRLAVLFTEDGLPLNNDFDSDKVHHAQAINASELEKRKTITASSSATAASTDSTSLSSLDEGIQDPTTPRKRKVAVKCTPISKRLKLRQEEHEKLMQRQDLEMQLLNGKLDNERKKGQLLDLMIKNHTSATEENLLEAALFANSLEAAKLDTTAVLDACNSQ